MTDLAEEPLLPAGPSDRYFDYCLEPYRPRTTTRGKARSENLLWHALDVSGMSEARPVLLALQKALGRDMTVWGWKFDGEQSWVELYFYDPQREDARTTVAGLREILAPYLDLKPDVPAWQPWRYGDWTSGGRPVPTAPVVENPPEG